MDPAVVNPLVEDAFVLIVAHHIADHTVDQPVGGHYFTVNGQFTLAPEGDVDVHRRHPLGSDSGHAVLGNHDNWTDAAQVADNLAGAGIVVLRNERQAVKVQNEVASTRLWWRA